MAGNNQSNAPQNLETGTIFGREGFGGATVRYIAERLAAGQPRGGQTVGYFELSGGGLQEPSRISPEDARTYIKQNKLYSLNTNTNYLPNLEPAPKNTRNAVTTTAQTSTNNNTPTAAAAETPNLEFKKADSQENLGASVFGSTGFESTRQTNASFDINKFRSEVTYNDSVLPTHSFLAVFSPFKDVITGPIEQNTREMNEEKPATLSLSQKVTLRCDNVVLPNIGLLQEQNIRRYGYGTVENVAYGVNSGDITMQFIVDSKSDVLFFFEDWFDKIVNRDSKGGADMRSNSSVTGYAPYEVGFKDNYACPSINIFVYDRSNRNIFEYDIYDAYPVNLQSINLSWADENSMMKLNVTFAFTDFKINRPRKTKSLEESDRLRQEYNLQFEENIARQDEEFRSNLLYSTERLVEVLPGITFGQDTLPLVISPNVTTPTSTPAAQLANAALATTVKDPSGAVVVPPT